VFHDRVLLGGRRYGCAAPTMSTAQPKPAWTVFASGLSDALYGTGVRLLIAAPGIRHRPHDPGHDAGHRCPARRNRWPTQPRGLWPRAALGLDSLGVCGRCSSRCGCCRSSSGAGCPPNRSDRRVLRRPAARRGRARHGSGMVPIGHPHTAAASALGQPEQLGEKQGLPLFGGQAGDHRGHFDEVFNPRA